MGTHLERYSHAFTCAEINSSFYRSHKLATWAKWAESVSEDFRFSVKAPKAITHEAGLSCKPEQLQIFLAEANTLADRLGPVLFQLPPKSVFKSAVAERFFSMLRDLHDGPTVFEPRHPTWFSAEAEDLLQRFRIARVAADPAIVPAAATPGGWSGLAYYRLHGSPRIYYSTYMPEFLHSLATTIAQKKKTATWCIFDNTALGAAFGDAEILQRLLATSQPPDTTA
jgi:uncharacterized protein YecE (DUF72 family)